MISYSKLQLILLSINNTSFIMARIHEKETKKSSKANEKTKKYKKEEESSDDDSSYTEDDEYDEEDEEEWTTEDEDAEIDENAEDESQITVSVQDKKKRKRREIVEEEEDEDEYEDILSKLVSLIKNKANTKKEKSKKKNKYTELSTKKSKTKKSKKEPKEEDNDEYDDNDEDDEEMDEDEKNFIIMLNGGMADEDSEENLEYILEKDEEDYNSEDDEKIFMKENYQAVEYPKDIVYEKKNKDKKSKKSAKQEKEEEDKKELENPKLSVEDEYRELIDLKKQLSVKLKRNPKSKVLINLMKDCCDSIRKLVKDTRKQNTKDYYKLTRGEPKSAMTEMEYFKSKLSHKEQKEIMEQLKIINDHNNVDKPYRLALLQTSLPAKYKATVMNKLNMMKMMEPGDNEYHKMKLWVDTFMRIPLNTYRSFNVRYEDGMEVCNDFMRNARTQLDNCVYGHNDAKLQIMQMIGQWISNPTAMGSAIAIHGPMGTGKTSLVKDGISKILGREFAFIALGGAGDSSFLEGHSYTYEGSMWGKIVQILIECKCMNPIIYFDELDKISDSARGQEIIGILTHLIDTTQNTQFHDKYFNEIDFDLSKCLFIFSYNDESLVNPILRDRMYKIQTKGYDTSEKMVIAKKYMLPKIREKVNFKEGEIIIPDDTLQYIITNQRFTHNEQGVRNLNRCLEIIHTKLNLFRLMKVEENDPILGKEAKMKVEYPFTVKRADVDILIRNEENQNQSLLAMYV